MLSRRNIRIKVLQQLYSYNRQESKNLDQFIKLLKPHFTEIYQVYYYLITFLDDFNIYLESEREVELAKYFPNQKEIRNTRVIEKLDFYKKIEENEELKSLFNNKKLNWQNHGELFLRLYKDLTQYSFFIEFMIFDQPNKGAQEEFLINLFEWLINEEELFNSCLEDDYNNWENDKSDILRALVDLIKDFYNKDKVKLEKVNSKKLEDIEFGELLFEKVVVNDEKITEYIETFTPNWDPERLTVTDLIILKMAISEFMYFPSIPPKVTINEYLDIAKEFSTPKSHLFINGVLDKVKFKLIEKNELKKDGRGLIN